MKEQSPVKIGEECGDALANGLHSTLSKVQDLLQELQTKQEMLLTKIAEENDSLSDNPVVKEVHSTMLQTQLYYKKSVQLRKDVLHLSARSSKIKKRASALEKRASVAAAERRRSREERRKAEADLVAKPAQRNTSK